MNVPSRSAYQSTCVTRTVSSIDKDKMKLAGIKKCVCPPPIDICITPTISNITVVTNGAFFVCTVTLTGSPMSVQWYYITGSGPTKDSTLFIDDPPNVSGSTTTQLTLDATEYSGFTIVCSGADPCAEEGVPSSPIDSNEVTLP